MVNANEKPDSSPAKKSLFLFTPVGGKLIHLRVPADTDAKKFCREAIDSMVNSRWAEFPPEVEVVEIK